MKYIDADQIRAEIERRKKELPEQNAHTTVGADSIRMAARYDDLLAFLDTLPEQPAEELDEAAEEWCKTNNKGIALSADKKSHYLAEGKDAFKAGAKWQREQDQQLIELAEDHAMLAGMNKMKEEMMEKAVDGRYMKADGKVYVESWPIDIEPNSVKAGDEVRLIVLPKED